MRVVVLFGGATEERDVSIASAAQIVPALRRRGHDVVAVDSEHGAVDPHNEPQVFARHVGLEPPTVDDLKPYRIRNGALQALPVLQDADVVFLALHGGAGEDGRLQALLDLGDVVYTGSGPLGSGLAMDKDVSKTLVRAGGVRTPDWLIGPTDHDRAIEELGLPTVVKPVAQGSTVGLSIIRSADEMSAGVKKAAEYGAVMLERFIPGRELTVGVLGAEALAVGEIAIPSDVAFSYEFKYQAGSVRETFPALVPDSVAAEAKQAAISVHNLLRLRGYSRSDFRLDRDGKLWFIEVNSLPGMTATSLLPQSAAAAGIAYDELCDRICLGAIDAQPRRGTSVYR